jgi:hypothetical protein
MLTPPPSFQHKEASFGAASVSLARFDAKHNDVLEELGGEGLVPGFPTIVRYKNGEQLDYRSRGDGISIEGLLEFINS